MFIGKPNGTVYSLAPVPHVSKSLLNEIASWKAEECSNDDVVTRLRLKTVPSGYTPKAWIDGTGINTLSQVRL